MLDLSDSEVGNVGLRFLSGNFLNGNFLHSNAFYITFYALSEHFKFLEPMF